MECIRQYKKNELQSNQKRKKSWKSKSKSYDTTKQSVYR